MTGPQIASDSAVDRFAARSPTACVVLFTLGYLIVQPGAQVLLRFVNEPLAFKSPSEWRYFLLVVGGLGACVGAAWHNVQRLEGGWQRSWLDNTLRAVAFVSIVTAHQLPTTPLVVWILAVLVASFVIGGMWAGAGRLVGRLGKSDAAA
jgi:hypothetical protein